MPPSDWKPSLPSKLQLLHKLPDSNHSNRQWRLMLKYLPHQQRQIDAIVALAKAVDPTILFRTQTDLGQPVASSDP